MRLKAVIDSHPTSRSRAAQTEAGGLTDSRSLRAVWKRLRAPGWQRAERWKLAKVTRDLHGAICCASPRPPGSARGAQPGAAGWALLGDAMPRSRGLRDGTRRFAQMSCCVPQRPGRPGAVSVPLALCLQARAGAEGRKERGSGVGSRPASAQPRGPAEPRAAGMRPRFLLCPVPGSEPSKTTAVFRESWEPGGEERTSGGLPSPVRQSCCSDGQWVDALGPESPCVPLSECCSPGARAGARPGSRERGCCWGRGTEPGPPSARSALSRRSAPSRPACCPLVAAPPLPAPAGPPELRTSAQLRPWSFSRPPWDCPLGGCRGPAGGSRRGPAVPSHPAGTALPGRRDGRRRERMSSGCVPWLPTGEAGSVGAGRGGLLLPGDCRGHF